MCGIAGFIDFNKQSNRDILSAQKESLAHRGPDGGNQFFCEDEFAQIGLAHRRLSIIDLSDAASQPMQVGCHTIVFNGEIYNYREIKSLLEKQGHQFATQSDTEVLIKAFSEWGADMVKHLIGMFAIVIYDQSKQTITCIRDRAGVKPFFYYWHEGLFVFGSELKAILKHPRFQKKISQQALRLYFQYGYIPAPFCIWENCFKLSPGHLLEMDIRRLEKTERRYWSVFENAYASTLHDISFDEAVNKTEELLMSACQYRMVGDVPVGVFLSGGYDSACVTALLQGTQHNPIKTFTIGVAERGFDEAPDAKKIAQYLGTEHTTYYCTEKEALELIPELPYFYDEPFADSSSVPTCLLSKITREHVKVALSADGGDEIFAGYTKYDHVKKMDNVLKYFPAVLRKTTGKIIEILASDKLSLLKKESQFAYRLEKIKLLLKNYHPTELNKILSQQFGEKEIDRLMELSITTPATKFEKNNDFASKLSILSYIMAVDYETYLTDDIMQKVDRATMSFGLEGREPFLDHRIIEFAAALPVSYKYHNGVKKHILKTITHRHIPKELLNRPKKGFGIPVGKWLQSELRPMVDCYFSESHIRHQKIFDYREIRSMLMAFQKNPKANENKLWSLLMFQIWHEQWN